MTNPTGPRHNKPKTFCPICKRRDVITLKLPIGITVCLPCLRNHKRITYQNIVNWVGDHPPLKPDEPPAEA